MKRTCARRRAASRTGCSASGCARTAHHLACTAHHPSACRDSVLTSTGTVALQVREHLLPKPAAPTPSTPPPLVTVGTALLATVGASGRPAARFLLREQFVHKGLLLVLQADADSDGALLCAVLNRPTSASVSFNLPGRPSRRLPICGSVPLPRSLAKDGQGQLWLHHRAELGGSALGRLGLG